MCIITYFQDKSCKHIWGVVTQPCGPWMGFSTCNTFGDGTNNITPKFYKTRARPCPQCDLDGAYDRNMVRMVEKMGWGVTFGMDPDEGDWGVDVRLGSTTGKWCVIL